MRPDSFKKGFIKSVIDLGEESKYNEPQESSRLVSAQIPVYKKVHLEIGDYDVNINQNLITVTEDKVQLCLEKNLQNIGGKRWLHPLSLLTSLLLALATSEFDKLSWISSELLRATFIVSSFITCGWLIWELVNSDNVKEVPDAIRDIFADLRGNSIAQESLHTQLSFDNFGER